ncbi:otoferlin [Trichonephila clavata]|uniref:Otoferlin n=1 Tax=Trichonephila clavata TaxID=2740835 RepID=A0A8X6HZN4_TRICU|nr:otoferlin [Trichonephila clavata]
MIDETLCAIGPNTMVIPRASLPTAFLEGLSDFRDINAETDLMHIKNKDVMAFIVYPVELENVPEFGGFQEWLHSFELIKGKRSHWSSKNEKVMAIMKGCFRIYKTPLPPYVMDPSLPITEGEEGLFGGLPNNKPTKVLIRAYMVKALNLKPSDVTNTTDAYIVLLLGKQRLNNKEHYISKQQNPVFGRHLFKDITLNLGSANREAASSSQDGGDMDFEVLLAPCCSPIGGDPVRTFYLCPPTRNVIDEPLFI